MPAFKSRRFAVTMDMAGCPNRCRHCWLGNPPNRHVTEDTLRRVVDQFRNWMRPGDNQPFAESVGVMTWYREPDFAANYRNLWQIEQELSSPGRATRFELLSVWRLAHDESYAHWARDLGAEACQISFFGLEENTDYFTRRHGSFKDSLAATNRLLEVGIRPRWQVFLTERALPELTAFVELIKSLELDDRVKRLGYEFEVFVRTPAPDGEAFNIERLRPTVDALRFIPAYLKEKTMHYNGVSSLEECVGKAESDWAIELAYQAEPFATLPETLAFMVTPELDVFSNIGEPMPWWRLGNLKTDGIDRIMQRFEGDEAPGLYANFQIPVSHLVETYARKDSSRLYAEGDVVLRWLRLWGEDYWRSRGNSL